MRRNALLMLLTMTVASGPWIAGAQELQGREHLERARALLERIPAAPAGDDADEKLAELRAHFAQMTEAYNRNAEADWKLRFSDVERDLARMIGGGTYSGATAVAAGAATGVIVTPTPVGTAGQSRVVAGTGAQVAPATGVVPTSPGVIGGGPPAPPGTLAAIPAPGTPEATGAPLTPSSPTVLVIAGSPQAVAASQPTNAAAAAAAANPTAAAANNAAAGIPGAVSDLGSIDAIAATKVSVIGIKDLDNSVRRQLEQFRTELELFYTKVQSEATWSKTKP